MEKIEISFTPEIVSSYKRLSYKVWYALAELVDNPTQAYFNNKTILDEQYKKEKSKLEVRINYFKGNKIKEDYIQIEDNSIGMSVEDLRNAFKIGMPPLKSDGRSRYGLGMKTSAFWFGDNWSILTKKLNEPNKCFVELDVNSISSGSLTLDIKEEKGELSDHFTIIKIYNLHRRFKGNSIRKIKQYLSSIYRFDLTDDILDLYWNEEKIEWVGFSDDEFIQNVEGEAQKRDFEFEIDGKLVTGWAGVLNSGGRAKGGFSLIQAKRIIKSPPNGYKPETIFGEQEGGTNNLINQRIVGEIFLNDFEVTHTKDDILWEGTQSDDLDEKLLELIGDFRRVATDHRIKAVDERGPSDLDFQVAFDEMLRELNSGEVIDAVNDNELPPAKIIRESNHQIEVTVSEESEPEIIKLGSLTVKLYVDEDMSSYEPYVINNSTTYRDTVIVIVNKSHPYWNELDGSIGVLNYLRHCVYDGVAEWKAFFMQGNIDPDTVKHIKDRLLRTPFNIEKSSI